MVGSLENITIFSKSMFHVLRVAGLLPISVGSNSQKLQYGRCWVLYSLLLLMVLSCISVSRTWYLFTKDLNNYGFWSELSNYTAFGIGAFSVVSSFICSVVCVAMAVLRVRDKIVILEKLQEIDFLIQQKKPYRKKMILSHLAIVQMCSLISYSCVFIFTSISWDTAGQTCKLVSTCALVEWMELVLNIKERFERVNNQIVATVAQYQKTNALWVTLPSVERVIDPQTMTIPELSAVHWTLCTIVHDTSKVYGPHIIACVIFIISHLIFNPYNFFMSFSREDLESIILSANWVIVYVSHLYILVWPCALVVHEANKALAIISEVMGRQLDHHLFVELEEFAQQLSHRDVVFSACGLFSVDATIIVPLSSAITTYLAIIVQIHSYIANPMVSTEPTSNYYSTIWNTTKN